MNCNVDMPATGLFHAVEENPFRNEENHNRRKIGFLRVNNTRSLPYTIHEYKCQMDRKHKCGKIKFQKVYDIWVQDKFLNKTQKQKFNGKD